jgi:ABC-type Zn2+ transport system substrate-binding protein/surface adhesin
LADKEPFNHDIYVNKANYGIEKLICTMASCPDMRVRKNIAILLAKGNVDNDDDNDEDNDEDNDDDDDDDDDDGDDDNDGDDDFWLQ